MKKLLFVFPVLMLLMFAVFRPNLFAESSDLSVESEQAEQDLLAREGLKFNEQQRREQLTALAEQDAVPDAIVSPTRGIPITITVGTGTCDYETLQEAIDVANSGDTILVEGKTFTGSAATIDINDAEELTIFGGYDSDCQAPTFPVTRTRLDASGQGRSVVKFGGASNVSSLVRVTFIRMEFVNGNAGLNSGGGVEVDVGYFVTLFDVLVADNSARFGGGVIVNGDSGVRAGGSSFNARLSVQQSEIIENNASDAGGGIYCTGNVHVYIQENSKVGNSRFVFPIGTISNGNTATNSGGGIYADNGCTVDLYDAVKSNRAAVGGGVYATDATTKINMFEAAAAIVENEATNGSGGGAYLSAGADLEQQAGEISNNNASTHGGGVYAIDDGSVYYANLTRSTNTIAVSENFAGSNGGGIYIVGEALADIARLTISKNNASFGAAIYVNRTASSLTTLRMENVIFGRNTARTNYILRYFNTDTLTSTLDLQGLTFAENIDSSGSLTEIGFRGNFNVDMRGLIIWGADSQNGYFVESGAVATIDDSVLPAGGSFPPGNVVGEDPLFIDPDNDNFHIRPNSPAVDLVPFTLSNLTDDIDRDTRPVHGAGAGIQSLHADAGADEAIGRVGINGALCRYATVVDAIEAASNGDTIYVSEGIYADGVIDEIGKTLTLAGADIDCTTRLNNTLNTQVQISGSGNSADTTGGLVQITGSNTVTFTNMTLYNATASFGGILYVDGNAKAVLKDSRLTGGNATSKGGCARILGTLELIDSHIRTCTTTGSGDGAGVALNNGELILRGNSIIGLFQLSRGVGEGNVSADKGGGVYAEGDSEIRMWDNSLISQNEATDDGGGVWMSEPTWLSLSDSAQIRGNSADNGAGVYAIYNGTLNGKAEISLGGNALIGGHFASDGNNAREAGGGVYLTGNSAELRISSSGSVGNNTAGTNGGGIAVFDLASVTVSHSSSVRQNAATAEGGGVYLTDQYSSLTMWGGSIISNTTQAVGGGLMVTNNATASIENNAEIAANQAMNTGGAGGGVYISGAGSQVTLSEDSVMRNNESLFGGGVYATSSGSLVMIDSAEIRNNEATSGGGVYIGSNGIFSATRTLTEGQPTLRFNVATDGTGRGGGLFADNTIMVDGHGLLVIQNQARTGGGIFATNASVRLINTVVSSNTAAEGGGGVTVSNGGVVNVSAEMSATRGLGCNPVTLSNGRYCSEFYFNSADSTSAVLIDGASFVAQHTAFTDNHGTQDNVGDTINLDDQSFLSLNNVLINGGYNQAATIFAHALGNSVTATIDETTIADNDGWPIHTQDADESVTVNRSIIWGNTRGNLINTSSSISGSCNIEQVPEPGSQPLTAINSNPLFQTTARGDYFLTAASPAIDACDGGGEYDLEYGTRPHDGDNSASATEYDMGAFEYGAVSVPLAVGLISTESPPIQKSIYLVSIVLALTLLTLPLVSLLARRNKK